MDEEKKEDVAVVVMEEKGDPPVECCHPVDDSVHNDDTSMNVEEAQEQALQPATNPYDDDDDDDNADHNQNDQDQSNDEQLLHQEPQQQQQQQQPAVDEEEHEEKDANDGNEDEDSSSQHGEQSSKSPSSSEDDDDESNDDDDDDSSSTDDDDNNNNNNAGLQQRRAKTIHRDDDGHELSEYELLRLERIRRNKEKLAQLGLLNAVEQQPPPPPKKRASKPPADGDAAAAPSRSSLSRSSKQNVNYAELRGRWSQANINNNNNKTTGEGEDQQSLSQSQHDNDNYLNLKMPPTSFPPTKLPPLSQHNNNTIAAAKPSSSTSVKTKKKPRMAKFIYREFQRIQTLQQQTLRQAKRHCRWAKGHVQHWQKCMEKYQRHLERLAQEEERKCYGGKTLRELLREVEVRQGELLQAARMYDQRQQAAIDAAHLELQRQEDAKKMEIVDALERFPKVMKRSMMTLNKLLLDRAPRDPPPPRRSKRKTMDGTTPSNNNNNDGMEDVEVEEDIPRPMKKAKLAVASASLPPTMAALATTAIPSTPTVAAAMPPTVDSQNGQHDEDVAEAAAELPSAKKRHAVAKNVGGWVSPPFAQDVDRRWLERDVPDTTLFRLDHYVPQVGDIVLYYPEGHRLFLKVHPDWLGKKTRAIARLPLWERARKEQQKKPPKQQKHQQQHQQAEEEEHPNGVQDSALDATAHGSPPAATTIGANEAATTTPTTTIAANEAATSPPIANVSNEAASIIKAQHWWSEEWLNSIDSKTAFHPILCRVEKTQAEFPADTTDKVIKKDHQNGNIQIIWKNRPSDGGKKRERRPHLCLAVTLRALTPISSPPPKDGEPTIQDEKQLALPPKFTVVTFPSAVARPFLVPFSWAYRKFHTLTLNARVAVQSPAGMNGNITGAKVIGFDHPECPFGSLRLDDQYPLLARWLSSWQLNLESTPQSIFDALSQDFQFRNLIAPYPLVDALAVVETWIHVVKSQGADGSTKESGTNQATPDSASELDFRSLIRKSLPVWDGVSVARDAYDRRRHSFSPWDLDLQMPAQPKSPPKGGRVSSSHHHLTASLDNALRLKVEMTLEDFLKRSEHADIFSPLVSDREAPSYSCAVPLGMAFERILRRLAVKAPSKGSCYYRHPDAILSDIALIEDNCLLYNSPDAEIVEKAAHIVMEAKRHVTQVVSNHNRELDSRLKEEEQRQRFVQLQCDAVVENRLLDSESTMAPVSRKNVDSNELFTPYKDALYRDWLQDFEPDGSWVDSAAKVSSGHGVGTFWLPQAGDNVFYCESAHAEFLRAHYQSLTNEQCELPRLRRTQAAETDRPEKPDELRTNDSSHSHTTNTSWVMGNIQRVKAMFPLRKSKQESRGDGGFSADSPILALEVRFDCGSCDVVTIHWRPCDFSRNPCTSQCCSRCGLSLTSSFLHPAWLQVERPSTVLPNQLSGSSLGQPTGLTKDDIESVNRCFNLLKRRCISGTPPDFVDPQQCIFDLKRGVYPVAKVKASSLPAFEDVFRVDKDDGSRVGTRGVRGAGPEKHESILAEAAFLPRWAASNSNEDSDTVDPKRCESLFPCPNFCLELVQLRLRHGYYRHRAAILDEIEEAYIQSVLLLLSSPATRKKNPISIKKLARLLSSKSNMARYFEALSGNSWSEPNVNKSGALGSSSPLKPASQNGVVTGSTLDEETLWMARLEKIRRLYAIAHVCVSETALTELIFGTSPHLKGKPKEPSSSIVVNPVQVAARQKLHWVLGAVGTDFCLNRYSSPLPQVRLKITCGGEVVTGNPYEANDGQTYAIKALSFNIGDVRGHHSLAQLFFGRPAKMGPCARCQVYQRSMVDCRVVRTHSNVDFDWGSFCRDMGGIDGILQQLRTSVTATASAPPRPPEVANAGVVPTPDRPCPENSMDSHAERPTTPPGSQDSSPPLVTQDSSPPTLSQESSTPLLSQCSNTPSLTQDPPTPGHVNADNTPEAAESKCNESKTQITTIEGADKKSGTQNSIIESTNATDMESATQVTASEATAAYKESITNEAKVSGAAADGVDMELETLVDPREDFEKAMLAARLSSELLLEAQAAAQAPSRLHGDFISAYFPVDPEDGHYIYCVSCGLSGDLLCCDGCPNVLHQDCAGLTRIPEGDWFCRTCSTRARSSFPTAAEVPKKQAPAVLEGAGDNSPDFEEKWRSKFIGAAPFDFEKEAKLSAILEELRLSRLPPEVRKSEIEKKESDNAVEQMPTENAPSSSSQQEASRDQNSNKGMPEGFIQIGLVINKNFGSLGTFSGKVTSLPTDTRPFYGIRYDDGDQEDMSEGELQDHLPLYTLKKLKAVQKQQQAAPSNAHPDESSSQPNAASADEPKRRPRGRPRKGDVRQPSRVVSLSMPPRKSRRLDAKSTTTTTTTTTTSNTKPRTLENQVVLQDPPDGNCGSRKHDLVTNDSVPPPPFESRVHQIVNDFDEDEQIAKQPRLS